jgi:hypothetical protein
VNERGKAKRLASSGKPSLLEGEIRVQEFGSFIIAWKLALLPLLPM